MEKNFTEDLYKDFLKDKVINAEELISNIKAVAKTETDVQRFAEIIIDIIYSHAK